MNQELAAVTMGITAGKLDGPPLPVIGGAGKFQDGVLLSEADQPGLSRVQMRDGKTLFPPNRVDSIPPIDLEDGEEIDVHLFKAGYHVRGDEDFLQCDGLPVCLANAPDIPDVLFRGTAQDLCVEGPRLSKRFDEHPHTGTLAPLPHGLPKAAQGLHIPFQLWGGDKNALALHTVK